MMKTEAIAALKAQNERLAGLFRDIDDGRWWASDAPARARAEKVCVQATHIGAALDEIERLVAKMQG